MNASTQSSRHDWNRAYEAFPHYASQYAWPHIVELLEAHPGERVYEIGFGSGMNLKWARDHGWDVAGCDVADVAVEQARALLPGADLRHESMVDCSAPSASFDFVIDRAALMCLSGDEMNAALDQAHRILKPGGLMFFSPYGTHHTFPFPPNMPPAVLWEEPAVRDLFADTKWELLDLAYAGGVCEVDGKRAIEHTFRVLVRKAA